MPRLISKTSNILQKVELIYNGTLLVNGLVLMGRSLQFHFREKTYFFQFRRGFSLLCLFLFCLCLVLGVWQLHRYAFKKTLLTTYQKRLLDAPHPFGDVLSQKDLQFQSIKTSGTYLNSLTLLVQNRFYHDEPGFEVLTPLQIPHDKKLLLIDRGWIKQPENNVLPDIQAVTNKQFISGHIKLLNEYQFILGENMLHPDSKPLVVQRIDINELSQMTHYSFYPFILRLNANETNGYVRDWTIVTVTPARHMAYAIQWFLLAFVLLIAWLCFCCEEKNPHVKNA